MAKSPQSAPPRAAAREQDVGGCHSVDPPRKAARRRTALSSGATPASRTEGERSETEVKAAGVVACSELFGVRSHCCAYMLLLHGSRSEETR